jgi:hypothetical protein
VRRPASAFGATPTRPPATDVLTPRAGLLPGPADPHPRAERVRRVRISSRTSRRSRGAAIRIPRPNPGARPRQGTDASRPARSTGRPSRAARWFLRSMKANRPNRRAASTSISRSTSLSGPRSPRAVEPNRARRVRPRAELPLVPAQHTENTLALLERGSSGRVDSCGHGRDMLPRPAHGSSSRGPAPSRRRSGSRSDGGQGMQKAVPMATGRPSTLVDADAPEGIHRAPT